MFRNLIHSEIEQLEKQGCSSIDWTLINVADEFLPNSCHNVSFSGRVQLGVFSGSHEIGGGIIRQAGIYNATIHNCIIEDDVYISSIQRYISNYHIKEYAYVENCNVIGVSGESSFGNGTSVAVLNELGKRSIPIYTELTAQIAYLLVFYRDKKSFIEKLIKEIDEYVTLVTSNRGIIGKGAKIVDSMTITSVNIGDYCGISGVGRLHNGTIKSSAESPVYIGVGVIADNFIISYGSSITDRSILTNCYVGDSCCMGKQFSAENSLFFANFNGQHGEAYAIFAGPHTASHHKSTLLISAYFSFMNAGSGSNQSNHLYKLGPMHQGIVERGSKTASDSYILWPARVGAFTLILGRHTQHCNTRDMPYSLLLEEQGKTLLIPGVNIKSIGTIRDADKWPQRDNRIMKTGSNCDIINYDFLSPYTVSKMYNGLQVLEKIAENEYPSASYSYKGTIIPHAAVNKGIAYYKMAIVKYLGNMIVKRITDIYITTKEDFYKQLSPLSIIGTGDWVDISGCILPKTELFKYIDGDTVSLDSLGEALLDMHNNYYEWSWSWSFDIYSKLQGKSLLDSSLEEIYSFLNHWMSETERLDNYFISDGEKEFSTRFQAGFGIDGGVNTRRADFDAVRGAIEENSYINNIKTHKINKQSLYKEVINIITRL